MLTGEMCSMLLNQREDKENSWRAEREEKAKGKSRVKSP